MPFELNNLPDDGAKCDFCIFRSNQFHYTETFMLGDQLVYKVVNNYNKVFYCLKLIVLHD